MKKNNVCFLLAMVSALAISPCFAQSDGDAAEQHHHHQMPTRPPMDEGFKEAFDACASSLRIEKPTPGSRPERDDAKMEALDSCLKSKGYEKPAGPRRGPPGPLPVGDKANKNK